MFLMRSFRLFKIEGWRWIEGLFFTTGSDDRKLWVMLKDDPLHILSYLKSVSTFGCLYVDDFLAAVKKVLKIRLPQFDSDRSAHCNLQHPKEPERRQE
jgi:hypothetical protein